MVKTLTEANNNLIQSRDFYRRYIRQCQELIGNDKLSEALGVHNTHLYKLREKGSVMALYRYANRIEEIIDEM